jgi:glutamate--cysteine ligase
VPAPTRSLSVADVHRYVDEDVFLSPLGSSPGGRVGIELEWILAPRDAPSPSPATVAGLLPSPLPGGSRLTFEPGGQLELSGPAAADLGTACRAMRLDTAAVRDALRPLRVELVGTGLDTRADAPRVLDAPRYRAMEAYFDSRWPAGRTMMRNTASIQVNLDVGSPATTDSRWHLAHDIGPVLTACFANSPFDASGNPSGYRSTRAAVWHAIDPVRTDPARRDPRGSARDAWERYVLDATVMMIRVDDEHSIVPREPMSFSSWLTHGHECGWPTVDDLVYHTTTLFPPVRPRGWLELRMIDALPEEWWPVAVAVATALLDDPVAAACAAVDAPAVRDRWTAAARDALCDPELRAVAVRCFEVARAALRRLGADSATRAATDEYFERYVARGRCPADEQLEDWMRLQTAGV